MRSLKPGGDERQLDRSVGVSEHQTDFQDMREQSPPQISAPHATWRSLKGSDQRQLDRSAGVSENQTDFQDIKE
jgi:hypothetical protein